MLESTHEDADNDNNDQEMVISPTSGEDSPHPRVTLEQLAQRSLSLKRQDIHDNQKCPHCFLSLTFCICQTARDIFANSTLSPHHRNVRFMVYMHYKEWGRASNTGKLLPVALPTTSSIKVFGIKEEQDELFTALSTQPSLILYPSPTARPISEYHNWFHEHEGNVNLCVIDSTWPQSHAMERSLPADIPRVKIDEMVFGPSKFLNRKQSKNKSKVSTIESVMMALSALGWTEEDLSPFNKSFEYAVDAVLIQCNKKPVYNSLITPNWTRADGATVRGPRQEPCIKKPQQCLLCGATVPGVHFKNLGVRVKKDPAEPKPPHYVDYETLFSTVSPDFAQRIQEIVSKNTFRVWRCSKCDRCFPGEEIVIESSVLAEQKEP